MSPNMRKGFRGSLHGYKRADVTGYILELSKKYTEVENEYREKIEALEAENAKLRSELSAANTRAADAEAKAAAASSGEPAPENAKKAAEALSEIKRMRSQLKKRVKEFESKYRDVLPAEKKNDPAVPESKSADAAPLTPSEGKSGDFQSYLDEFRSSTSALFSEFDRKYGTKISGGDVK